VRGSRVILGIFAATFLVNGVVNAFGRLYPLRLVDVGLSVDPLVWLGGLGVLMSYSLLAQAKYLGEIACGFAVAAVAHLATMPLALLICGGLLAIAVLLVQHIGSPRPEPAS
jgi:hypothetical protein